MQLNKFRTCVPNFHMSENKIKNNFCQSIIWWHSIPIKICYLQLVQNSNFITELSSNNLKASYFTKTRCHAIANATWKIPKSTCLCWINNSNGIMQLSRRPSSPKKLYHLISTRCVHETRTAVKIRYFLYFAKRQNIYINAGG